MIYRLNVLESRMVQMPLARDADFAVSGRADGVGCAAASREHAGARECALGREGA